MGKSKDLATLKTSGLSIDDGGLSVKDAHSQLTLTDSDDDKFVLKSYSGGKYVVRNNSTSTTTNQFTLTEDGKFGVGTISPPQLLSLFGTGAGNATMQIEGEGGADPTINFLANNAQHWAIGIDDSDSDAFKVSEHSALGTNDYLKLDVSGRVTTPNQPNFRVKGNSGGWQVISSASEQTVLFGDEQWDIGGRFNTSNGRFTAPVAGKYLFHFHAYVRQSSSDDGTGYGTARIYKNGSLYSGASNIFGYNNSGDSDQIAPVTTIMDMAANDYANCNVRANSGATEFYQPNCYFTGCLLG